MLTVQTDRWRRHTLMHTLLLLYSTLQHRNRKVWQMQRQKCDERSGDLLQTGTDVAQTIRSRCCVSDADERNWSHYSVLNDYNTSFPLLQLMSQPPSGATLLSGHFLSFVICSSGQRFLFYFIFLHVDIFLDIVFSLLV